jgi:hypothetical protein
MVGTKKVVTPYPPINKLERRSRAGNHVFTCSIITGRVQAFMQLASIDRQTLLHQGVSSSLQAYHPNNLLPLSLSTIQTAPSITMEEELVMFGRSHGETVYSLVQGIDWNTVIGSRTGRLPLNEVLLSIITTLTKAASTLDGIEAVKRHKKLPSAGEKEARELFDELISKANSLARPYVLKLKNAAGNYPGMLSFRTFVIFLHSLFFSLKLHCCYFSVLTTKARFLQSI